VLQQNRKLLVHVSSSEKYSVSVFRVEISWDESKVIQKNQLDATIIYWSPKISSTCFV